MFFVRLLFFLYHFFFSLEIQTCVCVFWFLCLCVCVSNVRLFLRFFLGVSTFFRCSIVDVFFFPVFVSGLVLVLSLHCLFFFSSLSLSERKRVAASIVCAA